MANEIENKDVAAEDKHAEAQKTNSTLSALDLLSSAAGAAAAGANQIGNNVIGKLEITDKDSSSMKGELKDRLSAKDVLDNIGEIKELSGLKELLGAKELPLSRTERLMLKGMQDAIRSGDIDKVQEMLQTLAENPGSVNRVLREFNQQMQKDNWLNSASWEQGKDSNGNSFVRLHLYHRDSASKSSGGTEVTIGSDGRHSASRRELWNSKPEHVNPADSMWMFDGKSGLRKSSCLITKTLDTRRPIN